MSSNIQNSSKTKSVIRYSVDQLMKLRNSPLCKKPENFMTLEDWKNEGLVAKTYAPRPKQHQAGGVYNQDSNQDDYSVNSIDEYSNASPSLVSNLQSQHKPSNSDFKTEKRNQDIKLRPQDFNFLSSKQSSQDDNENSSKFNNDLKFKKSIKGLNSPHGSNFKNSHSYKSANHETGNNFNNSNEFSNETEEPVPEWANYSGKSSGMSHQQMSSDFQAWKAQMKEKSRLENMKNSVETQNQRSRAPPGLNNEQNQRPPAPPGLNNGQTMKPSAPPGRNAEPKGLQDPNTNSTISPAFQNFLNQYAASQSTDPAPNSKPENNIRPQQVRPYPNPPSSVTAAPPSLIPSQPSLPSQNTSNKAEIENQLKNLLNIGSAPSNPPTQLPKPASRPIQLPSGFMPTSVLKKLNTRNQPTQTPSNFNHLASFIDQRDKERQMHQPAGFSYPQNPNFSGTSPNAKVQGSSPSHHNASPSSMQYPPHVKSNPVTNSYPAGRGNNQVNPAPQYAGFQGFIQDPNLNAHNPVPGNRPNKGNLFPVFSNQHSNGQALLNSLNTSPHSAGMNQYPPSGHSPSPVYKSHQ
ncbi:hypothetical protein CONCODRAFT_16337 [Conidiobolus coronatus NRRL 28638]|uniref:Uncharacterized protein n=1 Tax=Conidiobolus coronatus (strain ATCC 28846 / CBS 209.66 / NRRL 28638) TaxID=796925 RepID=A0A137PB69_CONC2|nr:hypothetical protein CONCODRAFT_16337 [Conidiobolus coronatus NRRL 28638]|eukprot:KXN72253.1 hypothetical protein CONCODRAFT_16337 [Conidiobolus coronatus NRRL 28638]